MSSRPLMIAGIVGGAMAGAALFAAALTLVAVGGDAMSGPMMTLLVLGTVLGFVLDSAWLCLALGRLAQLDRGGDDDDDEGGEGWGRPRSDSPNPRPPSREPDWWPAFEHDFRAYAAARDRPPILATPRHE